MDYLIRGKSSIWLGKYLKKAHIVCSFHLLIPSTATMVQQCILKNVDVRQISHHNHTKKGSDSDDDITRISVALHPHDYKDNVIVVSIVEKSQQIASETEPLRKANDKWQLLDESARTEECLNTRTISSLMRLILYRAQHEESSLCLRMVCTACSLILPACMNVLELCPLVPAQLLTLIYIDDSFWGVKMELLELLERIDYTLLEYYEAHNGLGSQSICELIVNDVIWKYIEDEEPRVREKACATLITILPQLNLRGSDFSSEGIKRSAWDSQYSSMLQRQIISKKIHYDVCRAYFRDHEIENVSILMRQCLARLELVEDDKSRLQGLLSLLNGLSKKYGPFDETQTSLVNYNKGLGCIVGTQVLSHHCVEAIQKMLDIIRFHDASTDLLLHSILVENIGLYVIQFEHLSESNMQLVYSMTNLLLRYLFTMFNAISDLIEYSRSGKVQAEFNAEQYFSSTQHRQTNEEQQQTDIVGEDTSIFFTLTVFERFCTNVKRSLASGATTTDKKDALTCLMNSLLQTLYFVILFGDRAHITVHTVKIMDYLRRFLGDYKYGAILCLQEMFVTLFGKKSTYYSEHTVSNLPPIKIDDVSSELFGKLFIEGRRIVTMNRYASRSIARTSFLQTNSQRNPLALRNRVGDHSMAYLLDLFEPMVIRLKRTFRHTHSHRIHNLILFMLSRMVLTGVDFRRLDKDHSFLNYVLKLLDEMHLYMPEGTEMQNTGLYQIMDFLSILLFSVKYHSRELNHQNLLTTISDNISMSSWSATYILQSLGPMLIRSVTGNVSATEKPPVISAFATQLLEIVLRHINYVECVQVISTLLRATRTKDIELWKSLSGLVRDKIAHGISFGFIVSWSHLCREIDEVFSLFDLLHLDLSSNGGQQHNQIALDSMKSLYPPVLEVLEQWRSTMTTTTTTDLSNGAERPSTLHLSISEDMLLKLLFLMRWMNHRNSRAESMELKLQKLEMFLDASLCGMIVLSHSPNMSNTKEQLRMMLCRMLTETIHLLTTINSIHSACASDAKLSRQKATIRDFMILLDSTKLNPDSVDIFLFSTVLSLATNFAFIHEPFSVEMTNYCLLRLRRPHAALSHVDALQLHAHYFTIAFLVSEVKNVSKILERSKHELNDVFWRFAMQTHGHETITSDMVKRLRDMGEELTIGRHYESLLTVIRSSLDTLLNGDNRQNSFMGIRHVTEFIARLPEVAGLYDIIQHARNKCQYGAQRRLFDTLKDQWNLELASNGENERCTIGISFIDEKWRNIYETSDDCGMIESLLQRQNDCIYRNYKFAPRVLAQLSSNMLREYLQDNFSTIDLTILSKIIKIVGCDDRYMSVIVEFIVNHMQLLIHQKEFAQEQNMLNSDGQWFVLGHVIADILLVYSNSSNARSFPKWAENSIATIIEFHGSLSNLLYGHISNATNTPGDIAILLKFTAGVLFLLEMVRTACPVDSFDTFMRRACSLIIHATSKKRIDMTDCNAIGAVEEDVESIVQRVVSRVYPPIAAIHSAEGPVELKSLLGNRIPFIFEEHLPMLFEMHLSVARLHLDETYASCMTEEYRFHFDHAQIVRLMRQIEEIGCSESVFYRIWDLTFDVFQAVCMGDQHDDLPIVSLKLLTKLLCMMRLKDPKHLQQSQRSPRRPASGVPHKRNTSSIRRVSPTLKNLLRTLDEYLLTGRAAAHLFSYPQDAARSSRRQMRIEIDEILGRAIFSSFFKFVEDAIHKHKQSNLSFVSELVKSLNLIMFRNPKLFVPMTTEVALETSLQDSPKSESIIASPSPSSASSTATDGLTTSGVYGTQLTTSFMQVKNLYQDWAHQPQNQQLPSKLDFNHVFTIYRNLYLNDTLEDDWVLKQHLGTGMCKSFGSLPSNAREQHSALVLKMLKESLRDEHLRLQSYSGIISLIQSGQHSIIAKLIPFLSEHIQTIILSERIVHSQIIVIHMITSVIQYFPDASVHDLTRKAMEAMFSLSDRGTTPLQIVDHIYSALRHLLANYALSDFERKLIEALTSIKKPSMKETQDHRRSITLSSPLSSGTLQPQDMIRTMTPDKTRMASPHTQRRMTLTSLLGFKKSPSTSKSSSQHETSPGLMGSVTSSPSKSSRTSTASQASKAEARKTQLRQGLIQRQQEKDLIVSNPHARQMLLLSLMITSMYSSLDMIEIKASTTEDATGSASNIRERCKMNVLQLFQDLEYRTETRREAEVLLRFLPQVSHWVLDGNRAMNCSVLTVLFSFVVFLGGSIISWWS